MKYDDAARVQHKLCSVLQKLANKSKLVQNELKVRAQFPSHNAIGGVTHFEERHFNHCT